MDSGDNTSKRLWVDELFVREPTRHDVTMMLPTVASATPDNAEMPITISVATFPPATPNVD